VAYGQADWWTQVRLARGGMDAVEEAQRKCRRRNCSGNADDVVAQLSFGFWVSLLSAGAAYDRVLWVPTLHRAFPHYSGPRRPLHESLLTMVLLRNRIMHHEPICHRDLPADHRKLYRMLGYLSADAVVRAVQLDRVGTVLGRRRDVCTGATPPSF
jgi:hypothetical protein